MTVPAWAARIIENDPGHVRTGTPLFIYHGSADETIPVVASERLFDRLCGLGQTAERKVYQGQSHGGVVLVAFLDVAQWIDARIAGRPATNGCSSP
jgi:predicted esterase